MYNIIPVAFGVCDHGPFLSNLTLLTTRPRTVDLLFRNNPALFQTRTYGALLLKPTQFDCFDLSEINLPDLVGNGQFFESISK